MRIPKEVSSSFTNKEIKLFKRLNTPVKIQDYLNSLDINFEEQGDTYMSPREVLKNKKAHCLEGAVLAAVILWFNGEKPWLLDLKTTKNDHEHVVAVFKKNGFFGAISKTNHAVLRYREPVYKTVRELAMSYFHEYFKDNGVKTLRSYSDLFDLSHLDYFDWIHREDFMWQLVYDLDHSKHHKILNSQQIKNLRKADPIEIEAGKLVEQKSSKGITLRN